MPGRGQERRGGRGIRSTPSEVTWSDDGFSELIRRSWADLRNSTATFNFWYEDIGALGTLEDIGEAVVEFVVGAIFVHPFVAAAIVIGSELGAFAELPFHHPTVVAAVLAAGGLILLFGPAAIVPAVVAGGVVAAEPVEARPLRGAERALATLAAMESPSLDGPNALASPAFRYIHDNIRMGQP